MDIINKIMGKESAMVRVCKECLSGFKIVANLLKSKLIRSKKERTALCKKEI